MYINKYRTSNQKDAFVEGCWNVLNEDLLETTDRSCGLTKKAQLYINKHGVGIMVFVMVFVRSENYGKSGKRETQVRKVFRSKEKNWEDC